MSEMAGERWPAEKVAKLMTEYPDFPQPGINFYDIFPIFQHPAAVRSVVQHMVAFVQERGIAVDVVAGLEARGFLLGPQVAEALNVGFVPVRKRGKLPGPVQRFTYVKEYGEVADGLARQDTLEMQQAAVAPGQRVLLVDDLLATGGTAAAAAHLVEQLGGTVAGFCCIVELAELGGRRRLPAAAPVDAMVAR